MLETSSITADAFAAGQRRGSQIVSLGVALPPTAVPNAPIAERLGVDEHWIVKRTGIRSRRMAQTGERLSDLVVDASRAALERANLSAGELDLILVATSTQDELLPNTAPLVAGALSTTRAGAADIGAACMGFISALTLATAMIEAGRADAVLVAAGDVLSRYLDQDDRRTAALIGDGAGAVVMTATDGPGRIGPCVLRADDRSREAIHMTRSEAKLRMDGQQTFAVAVEHLSIITAQALAAAHLTLDEVDLFVYHQANARILKAVGERLGLPKDRVVDCIEQLGNTSAASIPLALAAAERDGRLVDGTRLLLGGIGAGFTWGATVIEWGAAPDQAHHHDHRCAARPRVALACRPEGRRTRAVSGQDLGA